MKVPFLWNDGTSDTIHLEDLPPYYYRLTVRLPAVNVLGTYDVVEFSPVPQIWVSFRRYSLQGPGWEMHYYEEI
jgi:hypothetical protein